MKPIHIIGRLLLLIWIWPALASAGEYSLVVDDAPIMIGDRTAEGLTINGQTPGPILRFTEGEHVVIHVSNASRRETSIHWHGLLVPAEMDGVPGMNGFPGIAPGASFTYRFTIRQTGTYWYHAHSGLQEQSGLYGPIVIQPALAAAHQPDRDYVVFLSDFSDETPEAILNNLKTRPGYYNVHRRTVGDFFRDARTFGLGTTIEDRLGWGRMRMDATDLSDVSNYTFLINGRAPDANETFLFTPGERVRLRVINGGAMTYFDMRIPGLKLSVVAADGRDIEPVEVDELRIAPAETYDLIVEPRTQEAFTIYAEAMDRTGYARATLAPRRGMSAAVPAMRPRAVLTMNDMGMSHDMPSMDPPSMGAMPAGQDVSAIEQDVMDQGATDRAAIGHGAMDHGATVQSAMGEGAIKQPADGQMADMDHGQMAGMGTDVNPGMGLGMNGGADGSGRTYGWGSEFPADARVLNYADLRAATAHEGARQPDREIVVRLGGDMERYVWTINGVRFDDARPLAMRHGERVRLTFVNETMMAHPMHLHGMFVELENGQPADRLPEKHIVSVAPGQSYAVLITADEIGEWAFHCHLLFHMASGMMTSVVVARYDGDAPAPSVAAQEHGHP